MGDLKPHPKCMRLVAAFSKHHAILDWIWDQVTNRWERPLLISPRFAFAESDYYRATMGEDLLKQFAVLDSSYDPACLAEDKIRCNEWEELAKSQFTTALEERPINVDPGYMSLTKLVLASTKNREHRIYLQRGIYAEVTLAFRNQKWQPMPWTYPDYQRADFRDFFEDARRILLD